MSWGVGRNRLSAFFPGPAPRCSSLVVMHGNVLHYVSVLVEIGWRIMVGADTASHPIVDFRPVGSNRGEHLVGRTEVVALRLRAVRAHVREDDARIARHHHASALRRIWNQVVQHLARNENFESMSVGSIKS